MPDPKVRLGVLVSGRGSNLVAILEACEASKIDATVAVVVSDRQESEALEHARLQGVEAVFLTPKDYSRREDFDAAVAAILDTRHVDLTVLAGYTRLVTSRLIDPYQNRIINIHPSLLPSFPGLKAQRQALEWGSRITGCTVHFVDNTMDQGPIIIQAAVPLSEGDTEEILEARILDQEHWILPQAIQYFAEGRLEVVGRRVILKSAKPVAGGDVVSPPIEIGLLNPEQERKTS